jgi:hypothetical protein
MTLTPLKRDIALSLAVGFTFCFFFCYALALNPFTLYSGYDPSIFEQMGLGMLHGRIPYVDLFDHKGFLLYIINALGLLISPGHTGIYILLSLCLSLTFFCWLRISDNFVNRSVRYFPALITMLFALLCEGGNMTETWSLCAISIPIYYLVRYVCQGEMIRFHESFYIGLCIGFVANLRLNNIIPVFAVCIYMFIDFCCRKDFPRLIYSILSVLGGFCLVTLALIALYIGLYGVQYLKDYWFCNIGFNLLYVDQFAHEPLWKAAPFYFPLTMLLLMLCSVRNYRNRLMWFTLFAFLLTVLTTGTAYFAHYFTLLAPLVVLSISLSMGKSLCIRPRTWYIVGAGLSMLLVGLFVVFFGTILQKAENLSTRENAIAECRDKLSSLTERQKNSIWNYNAMMVGANILQCSGLVQCNRIFLPFQVNGQYGVKEIGTLEEMCPEVILLDEYTQWEGGEAKDALESRSNPRDSVFIAQNYRLIHSCQAEIQEKRVRIYIRNH